MTINDVTNGGRLAAIEEVGVPFSRAVVLGGSVTGLLAAAALAGEFDEVIIVERDELPVDGPQAKDARRGVPQGDQVHHLLALGAQRIEQLLPGFDADLLTAGCERHDNLAGFAQYTNGSWRVRFDSDLYLTNFTRPLFEWVLRRRVLGLQNVQTIKGLATGLIASDDGTTVVGAKVKSTTAGRLLADLVVDATGRGTKSPNWVQDLGFERPAESHLRVYMGYTCYRVRIPEGVLPPGIASVTCAPTPENNAGMVIWPCGNGEHIVVAVGTMRNYPPTDIDGVIAMAKRLPSPLVGEYISQAEVISQPKSYRMPGDQRLRWEDMSARPDGFVVMGDAVASYNPTYGQGMTMAAVGAVVLQGVLREAGDETGGVAETFQQQLAPHVDIAWENALSIDSIFHGVEYENLTPPTPRDPAFAAAFVAVQSEEPEVALAARLATHWMDNGYVQTESVQTKVTAWVRDGRRVKPEVSDPNVIPPMIDSRELVFEQ